MPLDFTISAPVNFQFTPPALNGMGRVLSPPFSASAPTAGFGEYEGFTQADFQHYQTTQKTHALIMSALIGAVAIGVIVATVSFPVLVWAAPVALIGLAALGVRTYLLYKASCNQFPPALTEDLNPTNFQAKRVGELIQETGSALVIPDAMESKRYKLDLIRNAQQSIFLSFYMGEEALDEALDLIKERLEQNRNLKVFILGSDHFLTPENRTRFDHLNKTYADRFFLVLNPEIYHSQHPQGNSYLLSTNHIKLTAIDQGAYSIIGGCALRPFWTDVTGTEHLEKLNPGFDFYNPLEAKGFRDMDFAFKSQPNGAGTTAFLEGAKLMVRYAYLQDPALAERLKGQFLEVMRSPSTLTQVPSFDTNPQRVDRFGIKLFSTGPDHTQNSYTHAVIDLINNATRKIVLAHMYFHPPQELIDALSAAAKRGVKIEIITNAKDKEAPLAHRFFVDLAQMKYRQLFKREGHENIKVHEFYRANTTYHKKAAVIDDRYTAFGSSNLGTKSMEENPADYEFNGITDSPAIAARTMQVLNTDIALSNEVSPETARNPSWDTRLLGGFQEFIMTRIL